jgi:hypothetical protein
MTKPPLHAYTLADPRPIAVEAPYTFFLPTNAELAAVGPSDLVKLMFEYTYETAEFGGERMWVIVKNVAGDQLHGVLDNDPFEPTSPLKAGDAVTFRRHHIISIRWKHPETVPPCSDQKEYWERCLVDDCVLHNEEPVEYIYREEPEMTQEGDEYPDSGWRIRGRRGAATDDDMEARTFSYVALGAVLNRDDSWLSWIGAPVGTSLMRDFDSGRYDPAG